MNGQRNLEIDLCLAVACIVRPRDLVLTQRQVAEICGFSYQAEQQIEQKALRKLWRALWRDKQALEL